MSPKNTPRPRPAVMSWSSGKDSALALHRALQDPNLEIIALLSSFNQTVSRVAIHGTRKEVAKAQAAALGLPLIEVDLPSPCSNAVYEQIMAATVNKLQAEGVNDWIFGDLFLEDIRAYREEMLSPLGINPHFPLWGQDTSQLARNMIKAGIEAYIVTLDPKHLPASLCGARYDHRFLDALPSTVDPCGEYGEFHTVVANSPDFAAPLPLKIGETLERSGFIYTDFSLAPNG